MTDEEKHVVPSELSGSSRCSCIAQVNECDSECLSSGSRPCDNVSDKAGITPLHIACSHAGLSVVQFLLERGAAVNAVTVNQSYTPLQVSPSTQCVHVLYCISYLRS